MKSKPLLFRKNPVTCQSNQKPSKRPVRPGIRTVQTGVPDTRPVRGLSLDLPASSREPEFFISEPSVASAKASLLKRDAKASHILSPLRIHDAPIRAIPPSELPCRAGGSVERAAPRAFRRALQPSSSSRKKRARSDTHHSSPSRPIFPPLRIHDPAVFIAYFPLFA